jgi:hypothetical protein
VPFLSLLGISKLPGPILYGLGRLLPWSDLHDVMDIVDVMHSTTQTIWEEKKGLLEDSDDLMMDGAEVKDLASIMRACSLCSSSS